jgi:hypothetical protein
MVFPATGKPAIGLPILRLAQQEMLHTHSSSLKATCLARIIMSEKNFRNPAGTQSLARKLAVGVMLGAALFLATPAQAAFHLWSVREIYSDASGTNQFIEFYTPFGGQQVLHSFGNIQVSSGANSYTFPNDLPGDTTDHTFLMGTASITNFGAPRPDFVIPNNFLSLGSGNVFFSGSGVNALYSALPSNGANSFTFPNDTSLTNSPQNFAGQVGVITLVVANQPPVDSITSPANNSFFNPPASIPIVVSATDNDGSVASVRLLTNGVAAATNTVAPFGFTLTNLANGDYTLRALAFDDLALGSTSAPVTIRVSDGPVLIFARGTSGPIQFQFNSIIGADYVVERGTPLTNFTPVVTNPGNGGIIQFSETNNGDSQRTYRVRKQ